jgi:hypothetical protein
MWSPTLSWWEGCRKAPLSACDCVILCSCANLQATVVAAERLRAMVEAVLSAASETSTTVTSSKLDYFLWRLAVDEDFAGKLKPFHRTRTSSY